MKEEGECTKNRTRLTHGKVFFSQNGDMSD